MIIAIDPGSVNTGVAMFTLDEANRKANLILKKIHVGDKEHEELVQFVAKIREVKHVIVLENFQHAMATGNFRGKNTPQMARDEAKTHALTKRFQGAATHGGHKLVIQEPRILAMGRKWCDLKCPKTGHIPDDISAYIHGAYYLMDIKAIDSVRDIHKFGQGTLIT